MKYATLRNDNNDYIYISKKNHGYYSHQEDKNIFDYAKYQLNLISYEELIVSKYIDVLILYFDYVLINDNIKCSQIYNPLCRYK